MGIFDYRSGNSQGILINALGMTPVLELAFVRCLILGQTTHAQRASRAFARPNSNMSKATFTRFQEFVFLPMRVLGDVAE